MLLFQIEKKNISDITAVAKGIKSFIKNINIYIQTTTDEIELTG